MMYRLDGTVNPSNRAVVIVIAKPQPNSLTARRGTAREPILQAAERVIAEMGARHLTLDAVAREAGVSKGGLLYHFPSKDELLSTLIARYVERCDQAAPVRDETVSGVDLLKGLALFRVASHTANIRIAHGMLAALVESPALIEPVRAYYDALWARIKSATSKPERALLPWLALEGLLFHELFNTSPLSVGEREGVIGEILALLDEPTAARSDPEAIFSPPSGRG